MEAHLGSDLVEGPGQKVGRAHPGIEGPERVFDGLSSHAHGVGHAVEPSLHPVEHVQNPALNRVFSTFSATNPSIYLDIDRDKVQILGVRLSDVFQALQASLGGYFVNNINLF